MSVPDALNLAHERLRKAVPAARRKAHQAHGVLAQSVTEAMEIWDREREAGVSAAERQAHLECTLRAAWPQTREWKYLCERCSDHGWEWRVCTPEAPCGRPFRLPQAFGDDYTGRGRCAPGHGYVVPCWCERGQAFRRGLEKTKAPVSPEDYTQAARQKPTRVGR